MNLRKLNFDLPAETAASANGTLNPIATVPAKDRDAFALTEEQFYSQYSWCLNPILSLRELLQRFREELDREQVINVGWQQQECKLNIFLFASAIACTLDDYLAARLIDLSPIAARLPSWKVAFALAQWVLDRFQALLRLFRDGSVRAWRKHWEACVDKSCEGLISADAKSAFEELRTSALELLRLPLPKRVLSKHMRLPEAFRCNDMSHHDVLTLADRFLSAAQHSRKPVAVVGIRTAGAYFAPLIAARLRMNNWSGVSWFTIRPKEGFSARESRTFRRMIRGGVRFIVADDHPNTGSTLRLTLDWLTRLGAAPEQISVLVPRHSAHPEWTLPNDIRGAARMLVITLSPGEFHKEAMLEAKAVESLLSEYFAAEGWEEAWIAEKGWLETINARMAEHFSDGYHVRLKKLVGMQLMGPGPKSALKDVLIKSVGWGWLGYHSYISGTRLAGFVPKIIGLHNGLLITEWMGESEPGCEPSTCQDIRRMVPSYVAARVRKLPIAGNFWLESRGYRWTGWDEIIDILRGAYGPYTHIVKRPVLRHEIQKLTSPAPTLIDGKMGLDEWIHWEPQPCKVDFEHHNFGGTELDIVDPAYDLAAAIFEFGVTSEEEQQWLQTYARESGDARIFQRILLYKLLYGSMVIKRAAFRLSAEQPDAAAEGPGNPAPDRELWNRRLQKAKTFLTYQMNRFAAQLVSLRAEPSWSNDLFFMDLDGVFDRELFGFPHTTWSGLQALLLLQKQNFSVILNTSRSIEQVRNYCDTYGIPGGIAEYGSVLYDAVAGEEIAFIDSATMEQLETCRNALGNLPGVFLDPSHRYSIRAYRYRGRHTVGLTAAEVAKILLQFGLDRLTFIPRGSDVHILRKGGGKGPGALAVKRHLGRASGRTIAIGDSGEDQGMLQIADMAFAPANCSATIHQLAIQGKCRIMTQPYQRGLLQAVCCLAPDAPKVRLRQFFEPISSIESPDDLIQRLLQIPDRRFITQMITLLNWRTL